MFKVVIVDDEYYAIEGIKQIIDWSKYGVSIVGTAEDGVQGLEVIRKENPDIVIADIRMSEMDGLDMISILRNEGFKGKVIIISGYQSFEYAKSAIDLKVDKYITKPFDVCEFEEVIKKLTDELNAEKGDDKQLFPDVLKDVLEEIELHYTERIQLSRLAEQFYCSTAYLSKLFKKYLSVNYVDYVKKLRIDKAKEMLKKTNMTIDEISDAVGWQSSRHFREAFKKQEGISPNEYRRGRI